MKVSLHGLFKNAAAAIRSGDKGMADYYESCLDEVEQHIRETIKGDHTLQEFADHYCLTEGARETVNK
jgi:hypothetical protein